MNDKKSTLVSKFLERYKTQYDFYQELARIGNQKIESELNRRGIKAIVSNRGKSIERLKDKIERRFDLKKYKSINDIYNDIVDLAGIRIALYFPTDRKIIDEIINDTFEVMDKKKFPESSYNPKYTKRFSGYWATHYIVNLRRTTDINERYYNTNIEIQVASVLMHAWAEVEHDLAYKPIKGNLSDEELSILDEINGLVLAGEIALERLQKAFTKRTKKSKEIKNQFELTNLILNSLSKNYFEKLKLGDTKILNNYLKTFEKIDFNVFSNYIKNIKQSVDETISDQLFNMIIKDYYRDNIIENSLINYYKKILSPSIDTSGFELFIKAWIILEKCIQQLHKENNIKHRKYFVPRFEILERTYSFSDNEINTLENFKRMRNRLLHGVETPSEQYLNKSFKILKKLTKKAINLISDENIKKSLLNELNNLKKKS